MINLGMKIITIFSSLETGEYFFSSDHCQKLPSNFDNYESFVPVSYTIPQEVAPRPGLEHGAIKTVGDLIFVYHRFEREIKNPNKEYQAFDYSVRIEKHWLPKV